MKNLISRLNSKGNRVDLFDPNIFRILLGVYILYKGVYFTQHTDLLIEYIEPVNVGMTKLFLVHIIAMSHIAGGVLLIFGLFTRIAALFQLPILIGAIVANYVLGDITEFTISIVVLSFILYFIVFGSAKFALDYKLKLEI